MLSYCKVGRLSGLLSCTKLFSTSGLAESSPCPDVWRVCCRMLSAHAKRSTQSYVKSAENLIKQELAKTEVDTKKIYKVHKAVVNQLKTDIKAVKKAQRDTRALLKPIQEAIAEKEATLQSSEQVQPR